MAGTWDTSVSSHSLLVCSPTWDCKSLALLLGILYFIVIHTDKEIKDNRNDEISS